MPSSTRTRLPGWLVGSSVIAVAMGVMNVTTYAFTILAARLLGPVHYGALAAMMGLLLVVNVLSLGLQATGARRVSAAPQLASRIEPEILAVSVRSAVGLALLCLVATPLISALLHLSWGTTVLLAVTVVPLTVMGGQAGILQGERRWTPLAMIYLTTGVGRLGFGILALLWRPDSFGAMVGVAIGAFLPTIVGWLALRHPARRPVAAGAPTAPVTPGARSGAETAATGHLLREVARNSHALLAFFALSNTDVLVARMTLGQHQAGLYAGGLILTKAVLFLPQFVVVIAFPSMASSAGRRDMHLKSLATVLVIGAATVAGTAVLSSLAVVFVGGRQYAAIENELWAFAALGTLLAMLQVMVYDVVARQHRRSVYVIWAALLAVLVAAPFVGSVTALLVVVAVVDTLLLAVLLVVSLRPAPPSPSPAAEPSASSR